MPLPPQPGSLVAVACCAQLCPMPCRLFAPFLSINPCPAPPGGSAGANCMLITCRSLLGDGHHLGLIAPVGEQEEALPRATCQGRCCTHGQGQPRARGETTFRGLGRAVGAPSAGRLREALGSPGLGEGVLHPGRLSR